MKTVDPKYIDILKKYDSPTICNVIELFKIRPQNTGFLHHSIRSLFPELPPMVGYAVTRKFSSAKKPAGDTVEYDDIGKQVEAVLSVPAPRVVVFQDVDEEPVGASFGEVVASTYMAFGCVGIITSGGARDTVAIRKRGLPLFARSQNVSHGYPRGVAINVPIEVGGVTIKPGDLLHGDADGVTTIPIDLAPEIALICKQFTAKEREWLDYVDSGNATSEGVSISCGKFAEYRNSHAENLERIRRKLKISEVQIG